MKRIADSVRLSEGSRTRIRAQIAFQQKNRRLLAAKQSKNICRGWRWPAIIIAAVLTLTSGGCGGYPPVPERYHLSTSVNELPEPTERYTDGRGCCGTDSQSAAQTLDEILAEGPYITAERSGRPEKKSVVRHPPQYGGLGYRGAHQQRSDALPSAGSHARQTAQEKMQYMAEDPADLLPVLTGKIRFDLTWLAEHYSVVIPDDQAIYHPGRGSAAFVSEYFWASYGANDGKGWFRLEIMHDTTWNLSPDYIVDGTFEEAYYYTTASGYEFLITADGDTVRADCTTAKTSVSLYGAYLTTRDLEQIVEHLALSITE
ncbi:MAG: hypothetical protein ACLR8L_08045 [Oscillospiraceae bacterium]